MRRTHSNAFTIIELVTVIAVIGILVSITIFGYGAWRERSANTEIKSDLNNVVLAMTNERNFNNVYPTTLPAGYKSSKDVTVTYKSGDPNSFCIEASSKVISGLVYFVNSTTQKQPAKGTCSGGVGATPLSPGYTKIATGFLHSCGVAFGNNSTYCWGLNNVGQLGNGTTSDSTTPVAVTTSGVLSGKTIKAISAGVYHTCVIASDDNAYCWGYNTYGQLGNDSLSNSAVPVAVSTTGVLSGKTIKDIEAGALQTCALASDNQVYCWGVNDQGQLGDGTTTNSTKPVAVSTSGVLSGKTIKQLSMNTGGHACVVASDNNAYCWGVNSAGQLGNNSTTSSSIPVSVNTAGVLSGKTIKQVNAGYNHTCAIASDNAAYCWGYNVLGGLGNNSTTNSSVPVSVVSTGVLSGKVLSQIVVGLYETCATDTTGKVYCWGNNSSGGLGNNSTTNSSVPVSVISTGALAGKNITQIAGSGQICSIASTNELFCWGSNSYGQIGDGTKGTDRLQPVKVIDPS